MQECGECTACCYACKVVELNKKRYTPCKYADKGCKVYHDRPKSCREYQCAWLTQPKVAISLRPDKCGMIFEKSDEETILCGFVEKPTEVAIRQLHNFRKQGYRVFIDDSTKLYRRFN